MIPPTSELLPTNPTITTQPLRASESPTEVNHNSDNSKDLTEKENLTEVTAIFDSSGPEEMTEEEKEKKQERRRQQESDCCCVSPYYSDDSDAFCLYILCHWICDCFRGIGYCTESCFEGCADCIGECCEGDACCTCDGGGAEGDGCGDCLSGCTDCCSACDCDCSS